MEYELIVSAPVVLLLVQQLKTLTGLDGKYAFGLSLIIGLAAQALFTWYQVAVDGTDFVAPQILIDGIITGLTASGLYSGGTTVRNQVSSPAGPDFND